MPLTPVNYSISAEEVKKATQGSYDLDPGPYDAKLVGINNHHSKAGNNGLRWTFSVNGAEFDMYTMFTPNSTWKLTEVLDAIGIDVSEGVELGDYDLELYIGTTVTAYVDFQEEDEYSASVADGKRYREIKSVSRKVTPSDFDSSTAQEKLTFSPVDGSEEVDDAF